MKKYIIPVILLIVLFSCSRVEIISDPYWNILVPELDGNRLALKLKSLMNGMILTITTVGTGMDLLDLTSNLESRRDVYILSPLLSRYFFPGSHSDPEWKWYPNEETDSVIYYFSSSAESVENRTDNMVRIVRDRSETFYNTAIMAADEMEQNAVLSLVSDKDDTELNSGIESFLNGLKASGKNISVISMESDSDTTEMDIRNFYAQSGIPAARFGVVFTNRWKNLCFELLESADVPIITSDSSFLTTYSQYIHLNIEDDIAGMLEKVLKNLKTGIHTDIFLTGIVY